MDTDLNVVIKNKNLSAVIFKTQFPTKTDIATGINDVNQFLDINETDFEFDADPTKLTDHCAKIVALGTRFTGETTVYFTRDTNEYYTLESLKKIVEARTQAQADTDDDYRIWTNSALMDINFKMGTLYPEIPSDEPTSVPYRPIPKPWAGLIELFCCVNICVANEYFTQATLFQKAYDDLYLRFSSMVKTPPRFQNQGAFHSGYTGVPNYRDARWTDLNKRLFAGFGIEFPKPFVGTTLAEDQNGNSGNNGNQGGC